jgi:dipeptidyl aminopeptidase/acylaminoacyl peptidase
LWFPFAENCPLDAVGCKPYDPNYRSHYLKFSPESYVQNFKTPHLIIHGSKDFRIPITEGLSLFTALQTKGIPSKLLHFREENHWILKPENSIKWYEEVLSWIDTYTNNL